MCRWLAYTGGSIPLSELIYNTRHSLIDQSLEAKLGPNTTNGDGFGIGWFSQLETPGRYRSVQPAWNDANLRDLCDHVNSPLFMAHIRASSGAPVQHTNCHPFHHRNWLFVHNGHISEFSKLRRRLLHELDDERLSAMQGSTDSELMFLLAQQFGLETEPKLGVARMVGFVEQVGRSVGVPEPLQMTLGISNGERLYAVRYSSERNSRSLYYSQALDAVQASVSPERQAVFERMTASARCLVSEPLSDLPNFWEPIPESSFITVENGEVLIEPFEPLAA